VNLQKAKHRAVSGHVGAIVIIVVVLCALGYGCFVGITYYRGHRAFQQAKFSLLENRLDEARSRFRDYCKDWPRDPDGYFLAARAARRLRDFADADAHLRKCQELGFDAEKLQLEYAMTQAQRDTPDAVEAFLLSRVKDDHEDSLLILEALIQGYLKTYQISKALHCRELWRQRDPESWQALFWEGMIREKLGNTRDALKMFEAVVGEQPDNREARLHLADLLLGVNKEYELALKHYERLKFHEAKNLQFWLGMAGCHIGLSRLEEAEKLLSNLRADHPNEPRVLSECGQLALRMGKPQEAEEYLRRALAADPSEPDAVYAYSLVLQQLGRTQEAKEYEEKHAAIRADLNRLDELSRKVMEHPRDADMRYEMGVIFLRNGREAEGVAWLTTALQVDPKHSPSHQALAEYFERKGMKREAAEHLRQ
jgi:tetratricopeptide (TPR) repeat protein